MSDPRPWHKSTYSGGSGAECVEVSEGNEVRVRDTQNRDLGHITFTPAAWSTLLDGIKAAQH
ncbi:DUF397 domain-containing protein [Nocardiopsis terrae]